MIRGHASYQCWLFAGIKFFIKTKILLKNIFFKFKIYFYLAYE